MSNAKPIYDYKAVADPIRLGPGDGPIDHDVRLGPVQVRVISAAEAFGPPSTIAGEAERYLMQMYFRDRTADEESDADLACEDERPAPPEACIEVDVATGRRRLLTREDMMEHVERDFGGTGALWLERVMAYDRWRLECLEVEARHRLPQIRAKARSHSDHATKSAWRLLDKPATTVRDVAVKLAVYMLEVGEIELKEEDAKPLRRLCAELLGLASDGSAA